jgi:hypothetical protein
MHCTNHVKHIHWLLHFVLNNMKLNISQELLYYMQSPVGIEGQAEDMEQMISADYLILFC